MEQSYSVKILSHYPDRSHCQLVQSETAVRSAGDRLLQPTQASLAVFPAAAAEDESLSDSAAHCEETQVDTDPPSQVAITVLASKPLPDPEPPRIQARHVCTFCTKSNIVFF